LNCNCGASLVALQWLVKDQAEIPNVARDLHRGFALGARAAGCPTQRGFRWVGEKFKNFSSGKEMVGTARFELEPFCGRERSRGPQHARFSRDGVGSGSPQAKSRAERGISPAVRYE